MKIGVVYTYKDKKMKIYEQVNTVAELSKKIAEKYSDDPSFATAAQLGTLTGIFSGLPDTPENRDFLSRRIASLEKEIKNIP